MIATLKNLLPDIESWPAEDQRELVEAARDIEARRAGLYRATPEELEGIDAGLSDVKHGRIASPDAIAAIKPARQNPASLTRYDSVEALWADVWPKETPKRK